MRVKSKEIAEYCEQILKEKNDTVCNMCSHIGINAAKISMWKKKDCDPRLGTLVDIIQYLGVSLDEFLGIAPPEERNPVPKDILEMEKMLLDIPENDRRMIQMNIKNYYDISIQRKRNGENL